MTGNVLWGIVFYYLLCPHIVRIKKEITTCFYNVYMHFYNFSFIYFMLPYGKALERNENVFALSLQISFYNKLPTMNKIIFILCDRRFIKNAGFVARMSWKFYLCKHDENYMNADWSKSNFRFIYSLFQNGVEISELIQ